MTRIAIYNALDVLAISSNVIYAAEKSIVWCAPQSVTALFVRYGILKNMRTFLQRGGSVRALIYAEDPSAESTRELVGADADVRLVNHDPLDFVLVADGRESISSLSVARGHLSPESPFAAFWTDEPSYAQCLLFSFEEEWALSSKYS